MGTGPLFDGYTCGESVNLCCRSNPVLPVNATGTIDFVYSTLMAPWLASIIKVKGAGGNSWTFARDGQRVAWIGFIRRPDLWIGRNSR
jgi:hypothetical protein